MICNLKCRDCPYGEEDFERRLYNYNKIVNERGIPNDIYHDLRPEDAADEFERFVWCDKVGGKVYCFGYCTDFYGDSEPSSVNHTNVANRMRRNKRERFNKHKNHLKRLAKSTNGFPSGAVYLDEVWINEKGYIENPKPYYKRLYRGKRSKYLKKQSHKKIRRYSGELHNGWQCHKLFDFWWEYC